MEKENSFSAELTKIVDNLYEYKNKYFVGHSAESTKNYSADIKNELNKTINELTALEDKALSNDKSQYYYLLGKAYNIENDFNPNAEKCLSKAVKLNPSLIDAWNHLGDSYFKSGNYVEAKNCFTNALNKKKNKESYRNLSMVCRKFGASNKDENIENVKEGLRLAQEALKLDPNDGISWYILGNAYISCFFNLKQSSETLAQAMDAYNRAEDNELSKYNADLYYNKAVALKFQENYESALTYFEKALFYDPEWTGIEQIKQNLVKYISSIQDLINCRGKMKNKKLTTLLSLINVSKHLGPLNKLLSETTNDGTLKLSYVQFNDLKIGLNDRKVIIGVVVCSIQNEDLVPFTFCIADSSNNCIAVTAYNLARGEGVLIGDYIAISIPCMKEINFTYDDKKYHFKSVRVSNPLTMMVNGKPLPSYKVSSMQVTTFSDVKN